MKSTILIIFLACFATLKTFAKPPEFYKVSLESQNIENPLGYTILADQVFKLKGLGNDDKALYFARPTETSDSNKNLPKIFISTENKVLSSMNLPDVETGWTLIEVRALAIDSKATTEKSARILAILNFEPPAGPKDAWDRSYVFDISADGKVSVDSKLNKKLDENVNSKKPIKTMKELKKLIDN